MVMQRNRKEHGFTLIELLIVIAIIAILALIAIPNFLEAQTRSKISRAMADMRSLATAVEAYYIDYNSYTWSAHNGMVQTSAPGAGYAQGGTVGNYYGWYSRMTTPVAFITSIPQDPFGKKSGTPGLSGLSYYNFYAGSATETDTAPRSFWALVCMGPDLNPNIYKLKTVGADGAWLDVLQETGAYVRDNQTTDLFYDPTNGTISSGDVARLPGSKLEGFQRYE